MRGAWLLALVGLSACFDFASAPGAYCERHREFCGLRADGGPCPVRFTAALPEGCRGVDVLAAVDAGQLRWVDRLGDSVLSRECGVAHVTIPAAYHDFSYGNQDAPRLEWTEVVTPPVSVGVRFQGPLGPLSEQFIGVWVHQPPKWTLAVLTSMEKGISWTLRWNDGESAWSYNGPKHTFGAAMERGEILLGVGPDGGFANYQPVLVGAGLSPAADLVPADQAGAGTVGIVLGQTNSVDLDVLLDQFVICP